MEFKIAPGFSEVISGLLCDICGNHEDISKWSGKFLCCLNCRKFLKNFQSYNFRYSCINGLHGCQPSKQLSRGQVICRGCRLKKAISLGFNPSKSTSPSPHEEEEPLAIREPCVSAEKFDKKHDVSRGSERSQPTGGGHSHRESNLVEPNKGTSNSHGRPCEICTNKLWTRMSRDGFSVCAACDQFLRKAPREGLQYQKCATGRYDCSILHKNVTHKCPGCRIKRAIDLGFKNSLTDSWLREFRAGSRKASTTTESSGGISLLKRTKSSADKFKPISGSCRIYGRPDFRDHNQRPEQMSPQNSREISVNSVANSHRESDDEHPKDLLREYENDNEAGERKRPALVRQKPIMREQGARGDGTINDGLGISFIKLQDERIIVDRRPMLKNKLAMSRRIWVLWKVRRDQLERSGELYSLIEPQEDCDLTGDEENVEIMEIDCDS